MEHHSKVRLSMLVENKIDEASALKMTKCISERRPPPLIKNQSIQQQDEVNNIHEDEIIPEQDPFQA